MMRPAAGARGARRRLDGPCVVLPVAAALAGGCLTSPAPVRATTDSAPAGQPDSADAAERDAPGGAGDAARDAGEVSAPPGDAQAGGGPALDAGQLDGGDAPGARPADALALDGAAAVDATPDAAADAHDAGAGPDSDGDATPDSTSADTGAGGCSTLPALFGDTVRPWTGVCKSCHDMTADPDLLKAPGPPWWHPTDDGAVVGYLLTHGLVDPEAPAQSRFLLVPLAVQDGGLPHPGGDQILAGTESYEAFVFFLEAAAPCVP